MIDLARLRVSLTKNGYMKIPEVVKRHPRWEVLENVEGVYPGIDVKRSQAANIMDEEHTTGEIPEYWDEIRSFDDAAIYSFTFVAVVFSHEDLIELLRLSSQGDMKGYLLRNALGEKAFTNLKYAMSQIGVCENERGALAIAYDLRGVIYNLREAGHLVRDLLTTKLRRCGWKDPEKFRHSTDKQFLTVCDELEIHRVFGLELKDFRKWIQNRLRIEAPIPAGSVRIATRRRK